MSALQGGGRCVSEAIRIGPAAIPALRGLLFAVDPSGLHHARCRAVAALAAFRAFDVLGDFLRQRPDIVDPVQRLGEDTVVSAAAAAIAGVREEWAFQLLLELAATHRLRGVLVGLAGFQRDEAVPVLVDALVEDEVRMQLERCLASYGDRARGPLLDAALGRQPGRKSAATPRQRRSAMKLLAGIGIRRPAWRRLRHLLRDGDDGCVEFIGEICAACGTRSDRLLARQRLDALRETAPDRERLGALRARLSVDRSVSPRRWERSRPRPR